MEAALNDRQNLWRVRFMRVEVLSIEGCPHVPAAIDAVKKAMEQHALTCPIIETKVEDQGMAVSIRLLGSPTIRVNGLDIEPSARQSIAFGMMCRSYEGSGVPSEQLIRNAIQKAAADSST